MRGNPAEKSPHFTNNQPRSPATPHPAFYQNQTLWYFSSKSERNLTHFVLSSFFRLCPTHLIGTQFAASGLIPTSSAISFPLSTFPLQSMSTPPYIKSPTFPFPCAVSLSFWLILWSPLHSINFPPLLGWSLCVSCIGIFSY